MKQLRLAFILAGMVLTGCASNTADPAGGVEKTDMESFCTGLAASLNENKVKDISSQLDEKRFTDLVFKGKKITSKAAKGMADVLQDSIANSIDHSMKNYGEFSQAWLAIRIKTQSNPQRCIIRSALEDDGMVIVEFYIEENEQGFQIVDWYDHGRGQLASDAVGTIMLDLIVLMEDPSIDLETSPEAKGLIDYLKAIKTHSPKKVVDAYHQLSEKYKNKYVYAMRYIEYATLYNDEEMKRSYQNFLERIGEEKYHGLLLIDYYSEINDKQKAIEQVDKTINRVGEDDLLYLLKAVLYQEGNNEKQFYQNLLASINVDPGNEDVYWYLLRHFSDSQQEQDMLLVLDVLADAFSYQFTADSFSSLPEYQALDQSKAYREWVNQRAHAQ